MKSAELRKTFLDFYAARDHQVVPSAPLVPRADPTLMFVNAGMVQFKDVFTGKETRAHKRATSSQKCIRISGKHNDLENVGVTARHHTFFEMLGNFSFGDYFKEEAIVSAWELLTKVLGMPTRRMVVTVFKGEDGFPADDEAAAIWRKVTGFSDDRVLRLGKEDNFWSMGDTGPCGPCSEIHYFHGSDVDVSRFGEEPRSDGSGWTEIWNLVFMQFDRPEKGAPAVPLPAKSIDTGAGLERMACVVQGVTSNYDTDVLRRLIARIEEIAKKSYGATAGDDDVSMRVIADHARTTAFLIAEGVLPDKQRREYVLRRVMRRAIRHGHRLGIDRPFLHQVALEVVDAMGGDYPELVERRQLIERVSEGEELRFRVTLKRGMKILDEHFESDRALSPEIVADLYTTYGFPLDLTEVIARERGTTIDLDAARKIVQTVEDTADGPIDPDAAVLPVYREVAQRVKATNFSGYETERDESRIVALVVNGALVDRAEADAEVEIAVERTPFYAEAGGQVGDRGTIRAPKGMARVDNAYRRFGDVTLHHARVEGGPLSIGDDVHLDVDHALRSATRRNHSATHLLHWALKQVLGEHAQQKGSLVGPDVLRFDFAHNAPLTREQI
ncbi:MAG TPA: alanine--tRNA ligase, partial [Polyangiaceae bacterium]|nr:alanine--tRNA ligase [Polyangiaceae bacterium]